MNWTELNSSRKSRNFLETSSRSERKDYQFFPRMTFLFVCFADELQSCGIRRGTELIRPTVPRGFTRETRPASRENPCASKKEVTQAYAALKEVFPKRLVSSLAVSTVMPNLHSTASFKIRNEETSLVLLGNTFGVWVLASYFRQFWIIASWTKETI